MVSFNWDFISIIPETIGCLCFDNYKGGPLKGEGQLVSSMGGREVELSAPTAGPWA